MKKRLGAVLVLVLAAGAAAVAYQTAARERGYREQLGRGDEALRQGHTFGAIEAYSGALALRPDSMLAHLRRGEAYQLRNELEAAAGDFRAASRLDPSATRPLEALGDVLYARDRFGRAAEVHEVHLKLDDQSPRITYKLALARYRDGNLQGALAALDRTMQLSDSMPDAYYLRGISLRELGRAPEAIAALERATTLSPGMIPAREELVELYRATGRGSDEIEQLQVIAGLDRAHVERQVALGLAQARAGKGELAVLTLGSALERTPDQPLIYSALGQVWLDMALARADRPDALDKALEALERAVSTPNPSSDVLTLYGRALLRDNRPEIAERVLQQATSRYPVEASAFLLYAAAAERQHNFAAARAALIDYGALVPDDSGFRDRAAAIGRLSLRLNDADDAVLWLARAAAAGPGDPRLAAWLADAQLRAGRLAEARATIAAALEKDPDHDTLTALARRAGR